MDHDKNSGDINHHNGKKFSFEIKDKDIGARIGRLKKGIVIETPTLMPVYSPNNPVITIEELQKEFNVQILMTNSYILLRGGQKNGLETGKKSELMEKGIHKFLDFNGLIATDSGSYQLMSYGNVNTTNKEIIEFQEKIGSDIGSFLDIPTLPDAYKPRAAEQLEITLKRADDARNANFIVNAGIQGSTHIDLRERAAREIGKNFELCAIGGIVRLAEDYRFSDLVNVIAAVKRNVPTNRMIHAFGLGHPIFFSIAVALGCDLFDSAAYALYAKDMRYLTITGTKRLEELDYLPCSCPVCNKYGGDISKLKELDREMIVRELARHNLYVTFEELNCIKQAIKEGSLWELISMRARVHPELLSGLESMVKQSKWMAELDPITKRSAFYYTGFESEHRTEVVNARKRADRVKGIVCPSDDADNATGIADDVAGVADDAPEITDNAPGITDNMPEIFPFGKIPAEISDIYPFGSVMVSNRIKELGDTGIDLVDLRIRDIQKIRNIMDYQFGHGAGELIEDNVRIRRSRKTGRIRWVYEGRKTVKELY